MNQFLSSLEADEPKIKEVRTKNETDIYDEQEATLQTVNANLEYTKFISNNNQYKKEWEEIMECDIDNKGVWMWQEYC